MTPGGGPPASAQRKPSMTPGHRVEAVDRAPALGDERRRIGHRRGEHPELNDERHDVADVAVPHVQRGQPDADAGRGERARAAERRQPDDRGAGHDAVPRHEPDQDDEADREVDQRRDHRGKRNDQPRKVDLRDQCWLPLSDVLPPASADAK